MHVPMLSPIKIGKATVRLIIPWEAKAINIPIVAELL